MANAIHAEVTKHLQSSLNARIVVGVSQIGRRSLVLAPKDLHEIQPEGGGLRFRKLFIFAGQVRFARVA
jgi:hypothetical protein